MLQQRSLVVLCCAGFMGIYALVLVSFLLGYMELGFLFNLVCTRPCSMLKEFGLNEFFYLGLVHGIEALAG